MKLGLFALWAAACVVTPAFAQETVPAPPAGGGFAQPPAAAGAACCKVPEGTSVVVETIALVSSRFLKTGDTFDLRLAEPLVVSGQILAPAGATGEGEVIDAAHPGVGGKPAKLVLAARYIQYAKVRIPLRGFHVALAGRDQTSTAVTVSVLVGLPGFFVEGGNVDVPAGTRATAKVASEVILPPLDAAPPSQSSNQGNAK